MWEVKSSVLQRAGWEHAWRVVPSHGRWSQRVVPKSVLGFTPPQTCGKAQSQDWTELILFRLLKLSPLLCAWLHPMNTDATCNEQVPSFSHFCLWGPQFWICDVMGNQPASWDTALA